MLCLSMVVEHYVHGHVACMVWKQDLTRSPFGRLVVACAKLAADLGVLDRLDLTYTFPRMHRLAEHDKTSVS